MPLRKAPKRRGGGGRLIRPIKDYLGLGLSGSMLALFRALRLLGSICFLLLWLLGSYDMTIKLKKFLAQAKFKLKASARYAAPA